MQSTREQHADCNGYSWARQRTDGKAAQKCDKNSLAKNKATKKAGRKDDSGKRKKEGKHLIFSYTLEALKHAHTHTHTQKY